MSYPHLLYVSISQTTLMLFDRLAEGFALEPSELAVLLIEKVVETDTNFRKLGIGGLAHFKTPANNAKTVVAKLGILGLAINVRPNTPIWPDNLPFDWTPAECKAALLGYRVRWRGSQTDFKEHMPGSWQVDRGGFVSLKRRRVKHTV